MLFNIAQHGIPIISFFYICFFLPLSLLVYHLVPHNKKDIASIVISSVFIIILSPMQLVTIAALILANYVIIKELWEISVTQRKYGVILILFSSIINIVVWLFFIFKDDFRGFYYLIGGGVIPFLLLDTNIKIYKKKIDFFPNLISYLSHALFLPRLFIGPFSIIKKPENKSSPEDISKNLWDGFKLFTFGIFQFLFLGTGLIKLSSIIKNFNIKDVTILSAWVLGIVLTLGIYHIMAGASSSARGVSLMFGVHFPQDWKVPFASGSLSSLSRGIETSFAKLVWENITEIFGASKKNRTIKTVAAINVGALVGLWLNFSLDFLLLGILFSFFSVLELYLFQPHSKKPSLWIHRFYIFLVAIFLIIILVFGYTDWDFDVLKIMLGSKGIGMNYNAYDRISHYINTYGLLLTIAAVFVTPLPKFVGNYARNNFPRVYKICIHFGCLFLFIVSLTLII